MTRRRFGRLTGATAVLGAGLSIGGCTLTDLFPADGTSGGDSGAGTGSGQPPTPAAVESGLLQVDSVEVVIRESFPAQVSALVRGTLPDACTEIASIAQRRDGNAIEVTITTERDPQALCAQALEPVEVTVGLGDFTSGDYTVTVNGVSAAFRV